MNVMTRWLVIQVNGQTLWPVKVPTLIEGYTTLSIAKRRAEDLANADHEEDDYVVIWDLALNKVTWGPI